MATTVICSRCRNKTSINNVRYAKNGKDLICLPCFDTIPKERPKQVIERDNYHCLRCNYKFSFRRDSRLVRKCPYCSSGNVAMRDTVNANSVLTEVTEKPDFVFSHR